MPAEGRQNEVRPNPDQPTTSQPKRRRCCFGSAIINNPNPVVELEPSGAVVYANQAAERLFPGLAAPGRAHPFLAGLDSLLPGLKAAPGQTFMREVTLCGRDYHQTVSYIEDTGRLRIYALDITQRTQAEGALRRSDARFRLLSDTAGKLLAAEAPQNVVNELCREVMAHLDCQMFFNFLVDESAGRLRLNAYAGIPDEEAKKIEWLDYGVARDRQRIIAEDIQNTADPRTELVKSHGIQAYCCHPLLAQDRVIGTELSPEIESVVPRILVLKEAEALPA